MSEKSKTGQKMTTILIWKIPKDVKEKFKLSCMKSGRTMRDEIITFMRQYSQHA